MNSDKGESSDSESDAMLGGIPVTVPLSDETVKRVSLVTFQVPIDTEDEVRVETKVASPGRSGNEEEPEVGHSTTSHRLYRKSELALENALNDDIYSLIIVSEFSNPSFVFAVLVFFVQSTILILLLVELIDWSDDPPRAYNGAVNRFYIPPGVELTVSIAQFFGTGLIVVFTCANGDVIKGFDKLVNGYHPEALQDKSAATPFKWYLSGVLQACVGILMIMVLYILMMQSTSVIGMCLNFAALHFVQEIDDVSFKLASLGLVSRRIELQCKSVLAVMLPAMIRRRTYAVRRGIMIGITITLYFGYFMIKQVNWTGALRCSRLYVQFGDAYFPRLAYFSGIYVSKGESFGWRMNGRSQYVDVSGTVELVYSTSEKAWLFRLVAGNNGTYLIKSSETESFGVGDVAGETWYANTPGGVVPMDWFAMTCNQCSEDTCFGTCVEYECMCSGTQLGLNCEAEAPKCLFYGLDARTRKSLYNLADARFFNENQYQMMYATTYFRNIYVPYNIEKTQETLESFIAFSGRRWIIFGSELGTPNSVPVAEFKAKLEVFGNATNVEKVNMLFRFAAEINLYPRFFSSPVDYGTPTWGFDPATVSWVVAKKYESHADKNTIMEYGPNDDEPVAAKYLCSDCIFNDYCQNEGQCDKTLGYCKCNPFYTGYQCEYIYSCTDVGCANGGICDEYTGVCQDCFKGTEGHLCHFPLPAAIAENPYFCDLPHPTRGPCQNKQYCNGFDVKCECQEPFYGDFCQFSHYTDCSIVEGDSNPCKNGGYCDVAYEHPICKCPEPYTGEFCQVNMDSPEETLVPSNRTTPT